MLSMILTVAMIPTQTAPSTAQFKPCVWPNVCKQQEVKLDLAQFETCVWPKKCKTPALAQFETCVYPKKCAKSA